MMMGWEVNSFYRSKRPGTADPTGTNFPLLRPVDALIY
jgi:hypothetical protein